jgi:hypothetical protein
MGAIKATWMEISFDGVVTFSKGNEKEKVRQRVHDLEMVAVRESFAAYEVGALLVGLVWSAKIPFYALALKRLKATPYETGPEVDDVAILVENVARQIDSEKTLGRVVDRFRAGENFVGIDLAIKEGWISRDATCRIPFPPGNDPEQPGWAKAFCDAASEVARESEPPCARCGLRCPKDARVETDGAVYCSRYCSFDPGTHCPPGTIKRLVDDVCFAVDGVRPCHVSSVRWVLAKVAECVGIRLAGPNEAERFRESGF